MAFTGPIEYGRNFEPGWFLESDVGVVRKTEMVTQSMAETYGTEQIVPMGTIWPANDSTAAGIVYEDINVTWGDAEASVVKAGRVYEDRLPVPLESAAKTALEGLGFTFIETSPNVTRPY